MANKRFKGSTQSTMSTPMSTPDKGNKPKNKEIISFPDTKATDLSTPDKGNIPKVNDNHMIAPAPKPATFYKKMPELQRGKGTWGGGVSRP